MQQGLGEWALDPNVIYLNHGSYGACPQPVLAYQSQLRTQLEAQPTHFFKDELEPLLDQARYELAQFLGATASDLVFVPNATTGVNTVLRSLPWQAGDQILMTNHTYNACQNAVRFLAERQGVTVVTAQIPFPIESPDQVVAAVLAGVSSQTRLALLDHVTSTTSLVLPLKRLVAELGDRQIDTLVDGAHAPGMLPLDLEQLGAAYYTGNCHKWLCTPKGAAFLHVRSDRQAHIRPLVISHGANSPRRDRSRFQLEFAWTGTTDPTPSLTVPKAIHYLGERLPGGWPALMAQNRSLALAARNLIASELNLPLSAPDNMSGAMATLPLPHRQQTAALSLSQDLWQQFKIAVPVIPLPEHDQAGLRISAQIYNHLGQYQELVKALATLMNLY
ncbi:MAG: aminotransferase class V-fold PLP-dependent enzyme [Cyanobacteria bacterium P01_H01_bin.121]